MIELVVMEYSLIVEYGYVPWESSISDSAAPKGIPVLPGLPQSMASRPISVFQLLDRAWPVIWI